MTDSDSTPRASTGADRAPESVRLRPAPPDDEISLWEVLAVLLRRRGTILLTTILIAGASAAYAQLRALSYTTEAVFRPQGSEQSSSELSALVSRLGVGVSGGVGEASPAFYAELLTSRELLHRVATRSWEVEGIGTTYLRDLLELEEETEAEADEEVLEWLAGKAVSVSTGRETGTVTLAVQTEWADLSVVIARYLLDELSLFNLDRRQSQAAAERRFIEERVAQAEAELRHAEDSLRMFLEANRQWEGSPLLRFRHDGLIREVTMRNSVYTTLMHSYEDARISEVRDTPVITVLQEPYVPPRHDPRRRVLIGLLGVVLGGVTGVVLAFVVEVFARPDSTDPARADFDRTWRGLAGSIPFLGRGRA